MYLFIFRFWSDASQRDVARPLRVTWPHSSVIRKSCVVAGGGEVAAENWLLFTMTASKNSSFSALCVTLLLSSGAVVPSCGLDLSGLPDKGEETSAAGLSAGGVDRLAVFKTWPGLSISLFSSFPEDLEMSDYCRELLQIFGQRYIAYANCLVSAARPVKVCQSCFSAYVSLNDTYQNISSNQVRTRQPSHPDFSLWPSGTFTGPCLASRCLMITGLVTRGETWVDPRVHDFLNTATKLSLFFFPFFQGAARNFDC